MTVAEANKLTPAIDWNRQLSLMNIKVDTIIVGQPEFFKEVNNELHSVSIADWKDYLRWNLINATASYLDDSTAAKSFYFHATVLSGVKTMKPRWKRVLNTVDGNIGEALGEEYVKKAFTPEAKERMSKMIDNMIATYRDRIKECDWMSEGTKVKAYAKLDKVKRKIGYPDIFRDYSALTINRNSYVGNILASREFEFNRNVHRLGKPVDHTEWGMTPPTVNAYYNPSLNEIVFPAGILQPPFFNPNADDALNYGGIGAVICHELTHGFDDQGCQYDADGNLVNWWTPEDKKNFDERAQKVINQFNHYTVLDTLHINGKLTQGENIADLGGVMISYAAFKKTAEGKSTEKIDGFTPDQRFFISWATVWRVNARDQAQRQQVLTNPHSPGCIRGYAPLTNMPEFYTAFNIKPGDPMYRPDSVRAKIW
jgi:putative endopeptidase